MAEDQWVILYDFDNIKADPNVVAEAVRERGRIVLARAYGDAMRDQKFREVFMEANVEIIDRPRLNRADHRGNDIRMAIDAVEFALRHPNVTHFALVTGDTDFIPLVNRLKLYGMYVTIVGSKKNTSPKIIQACDDYLCYEDLVREEVLISDDFQSNALAIYKRAIEAIRQQGGPANPTRVHKMIARIDQNFRWRDGGFLEFTDFLTWVQGQVARDESPAAGDQPGDLSGREIHAFNLLLRALDRLQEDQRDTTPALVEEQMRALDAGFGPGALGLPDFGALFARMAETGKVQQGKTFVRLEPEFAWRRGLKRLQITPHPDLMDAFLQAFEKETGAIGEGETPTLGEMAGRVRRVMRVSNQKVNDLVRVVKFSGALEPLTGEGYVTFHMPYRLLAGGEDLRARVLQAYLRKLARVRPFRRADLPFLAELLLGSRADAAQARLLELAREMAREGLLKDTRTTFHDVPRALGPEGTPPPAADAPAPAAPASAPAPAEAAAKAAPKRGRKGKAADAQVAQAEAPMVVEAKAAAKRKRSRRRKTDAEAAG